MSECKYCGKETNNGTSCSNCSGRLPLVKRLVHICDQIKALKADREKEDKPKTI